MKKIGLKIVGMIVIAIILLQFNVVLAATTSELNASKTETNQKIEEAKEELENINAEKSETLQQVEDLIMQISSAQYALRKYLNPLIQSGHIRMTIPEKPGSPKQKYVSANV